MEETVSAHPLSGGHEVSSPPTLTHRVECHGEVVAPLAALKVPGWHHLGTMDSVVNAVAENLRPRLPKELSVKYPARWECFTIGDSPSPELLHLTDRLVASSRRFSEKTLQLSTLRSSLGDAPRWGVVATFADGSHSEVFLNLPQVVAYNKCAEAGLVSSLSTKIILGKNVARISRTTLVGFASGDGSRIFPVHPNPCAPCRERLSVLAALGILDNSTELLLVALNRDGSMPRAAWLTDYGAISGDKVGAGEKAVADGSLSSRKATLSFMVEELVKYYAISRAKDQKQLSKRIAASLNSLEYGNEISFVAGLTSKGKFELVRVGPRSLGEGDARRSYSAASIGTIVALALKLDKPLLINLLPGRNLSRSEHSVNPVSSVAMQRILDLTHHWWLNSPGESLRVLHVAHLTKDSSSGFRIMEVDPRDVLRLGEGPLSRGRTSVVNPERAELHFSSQQGVCRSKAAKIAEGFLADSRHPRSPKKQRREKRRTSNPIREALLLEPESDCACLVCGPVASPTSGKRQMSSAMSSLLTGRKNNWRQVSDSLATLLAGASELQNELNFSESRQKALKAPAIAVIATSTSGKQLPGFQFAPPLQATHETSGPDALFDALVQCLLQQPKELGALHIGKQKTTLITGKKHEELLQLVQELLGRDLTLFVHHFDMDGKTGSPELRRVRKHASGTITFPL